MKVMVQREKHPTGFQLLVLILPFLMIIQPNLGCPMHDSRHEAFMAKLRQGQQNAPEGNGGTTANQGDDAPASAAARLLQRLRRQIEPIACGPDLGPMGLSHGANEPEAPQRSKRQLLNLSDGWNLLNGLASRNTGAGISADPNGQIHTSSGDNFSILGMNFGKKSDVAFGPQGITFGQTQGLGPFSSNSGFSLPIPLPIGRRKRMTTM